MKEEDKKIEVSELFTEIFQLYNVGDQREKMKQLSKKELYYLLICCMDKHNEDDRTVIVNYSDFEQEINDILEVQEKEKTTNEFLLELQKDTNSIWITTDMTSLPKPYTKDQIRELKLSDILD